MSKTEQIKRSLKAIREFNALPPDEQTKEMVAFGTINLQGEVLLGREQSPEDQGERQEKDTEEQPVQL